MWDVGPFTVEVVANVSVSAENPSESTGYASVGYGYTVKFACLHTPILIRGVPEGSVVKVYDDRGELVYETVA